MSKSSAIAKNIAARIINNTTGRKSFSTLYSEALESTAIKLMSTQKGSTVTSGMNVNPPSPAVQKAAVAEPSPAKAQSYGVNEMKSDASPASPSTSSAITDGFRSNAGDPVSVSVKAVDAKDVSADFGWKPGSYPGDTRAQAKGNTDPARGNTNGPREPMKQGNLCSSRLDVPPTSTDSTGTKGA